MRNLRIIFLLPILAVMAIFVSAAGAETDGRSTDGTLSVFIAGSDYVNGLFPGCVWTANASGGVPPYTYEWSLPLSGTDRTAQGVVSGDTQLHVSVWDSEDNNAQAWKQVWYDEESPC